MPRNSIQGPRSQSRGLCIKPEQKASLTPNGKILNKMREHMDTERDEQMKGQGNKNAKLWI